MADRLIDLFAMTLSLPSSELNDETSPKNTEAWDSLANMLLIAAIEETFEIELSTSDIESMTRIGEVRRVLKQYDVLADG